MEPAANTLEVVLSRDRQKYRDYRQRKKAKHEQAKAEIGQLRADIGRLQAQLQEQKEHDTVQGLMQLAEPPIRTLHQQRCQQRVLLYEGMQHVFEQPYTIIRSCFTVDEELLQELEPIWKSGGRIFNEEKPKRSRGRGERKQQSIVGEFRGRSPKVNELLKTFENVVADALPSHCLHSWVALWSTAHCAEQVAHWDYDPDEVRAAMETHGPEAAPFSLLLCVADGMWLPIWLPSGLEEEDYEKDRMVLDANAGDAIFFVGNLIHAGSEYDNGHYGRFHAYIDSFYVKYQSGKTYHVNWSK